MMKKLTFKFLFTFVVLMLVFSACQKDLDVDSKTVDQYGPEVAVKWYKLFEEIDRYAPGYRPPAASRALGYIGLAAYEAAAPGMQQHQSLGSHFDLLELPQVVNLNSYHWPTAVNASFNTIIRSFYPHIKPEHLEAISNLNIQFEQKFANEVSSVDFERSKNFGNQVAQAVFEWSKTDPIGHEAYLNPRPASYLPPSGPGLWKPTPPDYTPALFPYWGEVRTFAMRNNELLARPPLAWSEDPSSKFFQQAKEVQIWVDEIRQGKDNEGHWIAEFWSDDFGGLTFTPAARWVAIGTQIVNKNRTNLEITLRLYAQIGMAMSDVAVAVWKSKYIYNVERPVHYIQRNSDPNWVTILNNPMNGVKGMNPEFPAYPSGHSGFGGAAAMILTDVFGNNYRFTDLCHKDRSEFRGQPRTFSSFTDMAVENAYSRLPLGVHFRMDCDEGLRQGYLAGKRVLELPWRK
jgi:membrane-associated phospholipid phosphatase